MPRSSSKSSSGSSKPAFFSKPAIRPPPIMGPIMPTHPSVSSGTPSFTQSVKEGFSFGFGASIARNVVDRMFGGSSNPPISHHVVPPPITQTVQQKPCAELFEKYTSCSNTENCTQFFQEYQVCLEKTPINTTQ